MNTCGQKTAVQIHLHIDLYFDAGDVGPHTSFFVCFACVVTEQRSRIAKNVMECISTAQQRDLDTGQGSHTVRPLFVAHTPVTCDKISNRWQAGKDLCDRAVVRRN